MNKEELTPEKIDMMNVVAKGLVSMPDRMAVATIAMSLSFLHQKNANSGLTTNILGLINGICNTLCHQHRIMFLQEIKTAIEVDLIPMAEKDLEKKASEVKADKSSVEPSD